MALDTSPESPAPVRQIANLISQWVGRLGAVWIEGQVAEVTRRPGTATVFLTLRDTVADISARVTCARRVFDVVDPPIVDGARVVVHAKPKLYVPRTSLSLEALELRPVGLGELLARLERRRRLLAAEGLFATERKLHPPFLPAKIGLICGRDSAAERDILENARRRWAAAPFRIENVAVQGHLAGGHILEALERLERDPEVEVIVVARGGGSIEDLLPFSDEGLVRAVAACRTPVVSAIGHEQDTPLLDLVADVRASTPTDAARRIVPDVGEEQTRIVQLLARGRDLLTTRLDREEAGLRALRSRPVLAAPTGEIDRRADELTMLVERARRTIGHRLDRAADDIEQHRARIAALSPQATLERGYAVLQHPDGSVVRAAADAVAGEPLEAQVADGRFGVRVEPADSEPAR